VITACGTILLVVVARIGNDTRVGVITETPAYRWGLVAFWRPSRFGMN
jgi:hypothetical protein